MDSEDIYIDLQIAIIDGVIVKLQEVRNDLAFLKTMDTKDKIKKRKMGPRRKGLADGVVTTLGLVQDQLPESFDLDKLKSNIQLLKDCEKILSNAMAIIIEPLRDTIIRLRYQIQREVEIGYNLLKIFERQGLPLREAMKELREINDRKTWAPMTYMGIVKEGEGKGVEKLVSGSSFRNTGETLLEISKGMQAPNAGNATIIRVLPDSVIKLPKGYTEIYVRNVSHDTEGKFKAKIRPPKEAR